ncbi:hypothetical protein CDCA_CDCA11G3305 [Cyanidium caldarium]|uniref:Uncharacterized protein n=1 Tax=Cyanidium caldarium TaxID=2771 RepID=A0AAV9IYV6_CYACA|nr:hypothetical protein CDCA_CDCA11G3305 [Cyanidium caldarium]
MGTKRRNTREYAPLEKSTEWITPERPVAEGNAAARGTWGEGSAGTIATPLTIAYRAGSFRDAKGKRGWKKKWGRKKGAVTSSGRLARGVSEGGWAGPYCLLMGMPPPPPPPPFPRPSADHGTPTGHSVRREAPAWAHYRRRGSWDTPWPLHKASATRTPEAPTVTRSDGDAKAAATRKTPSRSRGTSSPWRPTPGTESHQVASAEAVWATGCETEMGNLDGEHADAIPLETLPGGRRRGHRRTGSIVYFQSTGAARKPTMPMQPAEDVASDSGARVAALADATNRAPVRAARAKGLSPKTGRPSPERLHHHTEELLLENARFLAEHIRHLETRIAALEQENRSLHARQAHVPSSNAS